MSDQPKDFKLLAIRLREGCQKRYRKNLQPGQLYSFYQNYTFGQLDDGLVIDITKAESDFGLFDAFLPAGSPLKFNVSSIVGKNGSGKSTLIELFFIACYVIAIKRNIINIDERTKNGLIEKSQWDKIQTDLKLEVYYQIDNDYHCLIIDQVFEAPVSDISYTNLLYDDAAVFPSLFYTIAINYSLHGLNESTTGRWIGRLFHKNDGYQTPVVLNPFRERGTIQIEGELHFAQTRLLTNLMLNQGNDGEIIPGKKVTHIRFLVNKVKVQRFEGHEMDIVIQRLQQNNEQTVFGIFADVYEALISNSVDQAVINNDQWRDLTIRYVIRKLIRITRNYEDYYEHYSTSGEDQVPGLNNITSLIAKLKEDRTHITLKLRQALNFYRYDPLRANNPAITADDKQVVIPTNVFAERLQQYCDQNKDNDPAEFVAGAPFTPQIILDDEIEFHTLSSGEQQYIHSVQAIAYHILNVNSVFRNHTDKITYDCINITLDEIELYFHPEFQRRFVKDLLEYISRLPIPHIRGINILFLTHSPFILSDIPATNVLRLVDGQVDPRQPLTFAGNIHQMLTGSFFMDATTGDLARHHYNRIIAIYQKVKSAGKENQYSFREEYAENRARFYFIVSQIGEDVIREVLKNHLAFIDEQLEFGNSPSEQKKILEAQLADIQQQIDIINATNSLS